MVNRIWRWHFGRGLVGTPDNFGALGDRPHNPMLLDWLALRLRRRGLVDQGDAPADHALQHLSDEQRRLDAGDRAVDPENRLPLADERPPARSRGDPRRPAGRRRHAGPDDGGLAAHGQESRLFLRPHVARCDRGTTAARRSVYLPVVRNHLYDMFQLFDRADPSVTTGDRATTTVAPQALFMMNSDLVLQAARDHGRRAARPRGAGRRAAGSTCCTKGLRPPAVTRRDGRGPRPSLGRFEHELAAGRSRTGRRPASAPGRRSARSSWCRTNSSTSARREDRDDG